MATIRILSTRKLLPNQKQYLLNAGIAVVEADFITISLKTFSLNHPAPNLIFTSTNAFKSFLNNTVTGETTNYNIFCVGSKTREFIEKNGYTVVASADYAAELADKIIGGYSGQSFTFFSGNLRQDTLPDALKRAGISFNEVPVYETVLSSHKINTALDGILFFSPSGVESYLRQNTIKHEVCFCIGTTTAKPLEDLTERIVIANKPTVENVIIQCINYYKNITPARS